MLTNVLTFGIPSFSVLFCAICAYLCTKRHRNTKMYRDLTTLSLELNDLAGSVDSLLQSHRRLRSRVGMREKREREKSDSTAAAGGMPDPHTDPEGWKKAMRKKIHLEGVR